MLHLQQMCYKMVLMDDFDISKPNSVWCFEENLSFELRAIFTVYMTQVTHLCSSWHGLHTSICLWANSISYKQIEKVQKQWAMSTDSKANYNDSKNVSTVCICKHKHRSSHHGHLAKSK